MNRCFYTEFDCNWTICKYFARPIFSLLQQFGLRINRIDEPDFISALGTDLIGSQQQFQSATKSDQSYQSLSSTITSDQTEFHFRLPELRIVRGQTQRARHRNFASAAKRITIDCGNHRLSKIFNDVQYVVTATRSILAI